MTIQKELDISESPEYLRIKQENQILQAETARHVVERSELQDLREEMEAMKRNNENLQYELRKMLSLGEFGKNVYMNQQVSMANDPQYRDEVHQTLEVRKRKRENRHKVLVAGTRKLATMC